MTFAEVTRALWKQSLAVQALTASVGFAGRAITVSRTILVSPPANLAAIVHEALFHPPTFRAVNAPGSPIPGEVDPELERVIHEALFHPRTFRAVNAPGSPLRKVQ